MPTNSTHSVLLSPTGEMYVCGDGKYGKLGTGNKFSQPRLVKVPGPSFISVSTGMDHTVAIANDHTLWVCGKNKSGELGMPFCIVNVIRMTQITEFSPNLRNDQFRKIDDVASVAVGTGFTLLLGNDGQVGFMGTIVFSYFDNVRPGPTEKPRHVPRTIYLEKKAIQISAGNNHCLILDSSNCVHSFGINDYCQLGHADLIARRFPEMIPNLFDIVSISSGTDHNICLSASGIVYTFGSNCYGQLGIDVKNTYHSCPQQASLGKVGIDCGGNYSILYDDYCNVWMCGENTYGIFTSDHSGHRRKFEIVPEFENMKIIPGSNHLFAIDMDGNIYSRGMNNSYQLGRSGEPYWKLFLVQDIVFPRPVLRPKSATSTFVSQ